ncbi:hypothetical protein D3C71_1362230 [compost metagenome]
MLELARIKGIPQIGITGAINCIVRRHLITREHQSLAAQQRGRLIVGFGPRQLVCGFILRRFQRIGVLLGNLTIVRDIKVGHCFLRASGAHQPPRQQLAQLHLRRKRLAVVVVGIDRF